MSADGSIIIDTPEGISMYYWLARRAALKLEIRTGMTSSRGSILKFLQEKGVTKARTKRGALKDLNAYIEANGGPADSNPITD